MPLTMVVFARSTVFTIDTAYVRGSNKLFSLDQSNTVSIERSDTVPGTRIPAFGLARYELAVKMSSARLCLKQDPGGVPQSHATLGRGGPGR